MADEEKSRDGSSAVDEPGVSDLEEGSGHRETGKGEQAASPDANVVDWDGDDDPKNPRYVSSFNRSPLYVSQSMSLITDAS